MDTTFDGLLNKRVMIEQPAKGYRIAVDTVLLAASVPAHPGQKILDMGCGVGGAMICLAAYVPELHLTGVDIQLELVEICRRNIVLNKLQERAEALVADVTQYGGKDFNHVIMNPPFHKEEKHSVSDNNIKRTANAEKTGDLPLWLESAARALKPTGIVTLIHRADRQDEILQIAVKHFGRIDIIPIVAREDTPPKRLIFQMHKEGVSQVRIGKNFILYGANGRYNEGAEAVIRHAQPLKFTEI